MRGGGNLTGVSSKLRYHNQFADCVSEAAGAREVSGRREVREGREDHSVLRGSGLRRRKYDHLHGNIAAHGDSVAVSGGRERADVPVACTKVYVVEWPLVQYRGYS